MKFPPTSTSARISEIFSSLQGEGTRVGEKHLFVRFEECHIHCQYCDELGKQGLEREVRQVVEELKHLEKEEGPHSFVSLTGGEPLLYISFLKNLVPEIRKLGLKIYLETDGILWKALQETIDLYDCIAMDMKPPSVTGEKNFDYEHEEFLNLIANRDAFVKIVLSRDIDLLEFERHVAIIARNNPRIPLILQPLSGEGEGHDDKELMMLLAGLQSLAMKRLETVRIVPRMHKILGIR